MRKLTNIFLVLLFTHFCQGSPNLKKFDDGSGPRAVLNIGIDNNFRLGFGIRNFGLDYTLGIRFFDRFTIGPGIGIKAIGIPIFTSLGLNQEPRIRLSTVPVFAHTSVIFYKNSPFEVYGYGMLGRAFHFSTARNTVDKSVGSIYGEFGVGAKWDSSRRSRVGIEIGQFYTKAKGTGTFDYLDSESSVDYHVRVFNISINISYTLFF